MRKLTRDELVRESEIKKRNGFDAAIKMRYGYSFTLLTRNRVKGSSQEVYDAFDLPFDEISPEIPEADIVNAQGKPMHSSSAADMLMSDEVLIPQWWDVRLTKVIRRNFDSDGKVLRYYNDILILNTILYDFHFPDGAIKTHSENLIAENILTQVDADGYHNQLLEGILDHYNDN